MTLAPIVIAYFTGSGHTARLAEHIADGMSGEPAMVDVKTMDAGHWDALDAAPAILFGTPTYMGSAAAQFSAFLEDASSRWMEFGWMDKMAGGFTVATSPSGDKLAALQRLSIFAAQMGMVWVGPSEIGAPADPSKPGINRDGSWLGLMATSSHDKALLIDPDDTESARRFGARFEAAVRRWEKGAEPTG